MNELSKNINQIRQLCARYNVNALFAFGSVLTNDFNADSDVDFVVDISGDDPLVYSDNYFELNSNLRIFLTGRLIY